MPPRLPPLTEEPPLVLHARALAVRLGFPLTKEQAGPDRPCASLPDTGRFLAVLAAGCKRGRIAEIGTGAGLATAWMASAMPADCTLITVEIDPVLAAAVGALFASDGRVQVIAGDARRVLPSFGPFDLLFADGGMPNPDEMAALVSMLRSGGRIVMDDVTPSGLLPRDSPLLRDDSKREFFFGDGRLASTEVVLPDLRNSLLVGTRRAWRRHARRATLPYFDATEAALQPSVP